MFPFTCTACAGHPAHIRHNAQHAACARAPNMTFSAACHRRATFCTPRAGIAWRNAPSPRHLKVPAFMPTPPPPQAQSAYPIRFSCLPPQPHRPPRSSQLHLIDRHDHHSSILTPPQHPLQPLLPRAPRRPRPPSLPALLPSPRHLHRQSLPSSASSGLPPASLPCSFPWR